VKAVAVLAAAAAAATLAGTAAPSRAGAALPAPIAVPGGVYTGSVTIAGQRCRGRCRVRVEVTADGLELTSRSGLSGGRTPCYTGSLAAARLRRDGSFVTDHDSGAGAYPARGRFARGGRSLTGVTRALCDRERRVRFRARLTGRRPAPAAGAVTDCELVDGPGNPYVTAGQIVQPVARALGCGLARDAGRALVGRGACAFRRLVAGGRCSVSGLACAAAPAGALDPAATVACVPAGAPPGGPARVELLRLATCPGVADRLGLAAPGVGCAAARRLAALDVACGVLECPPDGGFACARLGGTAPERSIRCADRRDPRRVVVLLDLSSDVT